MTEELEDNRKLDAAFNRVVKSLKKDVRHEEWAQREPARRENLAERAGRQVREEEAAMSLEDRAARERQQDRAKQVLERDR